MAQRILWWQSQEIRMTWVIYGEHLLQPELRWLCLQCRIILDMKKLYYVVSVIPQTHWWNCKKILQGVCMIQTVWEVNQSYPGEY